MQKSDLAYNLPDGRIKCLACARGCILSEGQVGFCGVRKVIEGRLQLLVYGIVDAVHMDPIEKKPVMHYRPGSRIFSIGTTGCSWMCMYCQNFDLSQRRKVEGQSITPQEVVKAAMEYNADGIAFTYNEPTIFMEFARDVGIEAKKKGLFNVFVSNGYATPESVKMMGDFLDSITVDFKGNGERNFLRKYAGVPDPKPIFNTLEQIRDLGTVHIEITDLVVPEVGDNVDSARALVRWIYRELGRDTPVHFLRFHPDYKMNWLRATPISTLEEHWKIAKEEGLNYVYVGNVHGHKYENTYCPKCGTAVIERNGFDIVSWNLDESNRCLNCGNQIPIVGGLNRESLKISRFHEVNL
ncbi:MAG: AmmeMemoRadiSam system radical SAM enzyme [Nitrososphaerota archaeon]|nr:AmmeMemoRadiSam system radical SAM enzyme [Nitrososphaerota archaeon]